MSHSKPLRRAVVAVACTVVGSLGAATSAIAKTPSPTGMFVIGDAQPTDTGDHVTFWGAQWWKDNPLSTELAPPSFKGFADSAVVDATTCGDSWTTRPGNSSAPPAAPLDDVIPVLVSSAITKSGPVISGDVTRVVSVQVDPGYEPNPGHPGTGTVVGVVCDGSVVPT